MSVPISFCRGPSNLRPSGKDRPRMPQEGAMRGPRGGTRTDILSPSPKAEPRDRQQAPQRHQRPHDPPQEAPRKPPSGPREASQETLRSLPRTICYRKNWLSKSWCRHSPGQPWPTLLSNAMRAGSERARSDSASWYQRWQHDDHRVRAGTHGVSFAMCAISEPARSEKASFRKR